MKRVLVRLFPELHINEHREFDGVGVVVRGFRHSASLHARVILDGATCRLGDLGDVLDVLSVLFVWWDW